MHGCSIGTCQQALGIGAVTKALNNCKCASTSRGVEADDVIESFESWIVSDVSTMSVKDDVLTHDLEEGLRVHPTRRREVCPSLLQGVHRSADAVEGRHT